MYSGRSGEYLLAIESSCDETAAAVVTRDLRVLSNVVASQAGLHQRWGGVVPEIASRAHVQRLLPVIDEALRKAGISLRDVTAIAVVTEPGLVGSLLVGLTAAKTLAWTLDVPLVAVNHVEAHLYACRLAAGREIFPAVGLVVSGGHSNLYDCRSATDCRLLGSTIDDAAGEAFDKVASILGLPYPGGPSIERAAQDGDRRAFAFPRSFLKEERLDFSFSGVKTAVLYEVRGVPGRRRQRHPLPLGEGRVREIEGGSKPSPPTPLPEGEGSDISPPLTPQRIADVAASFQEAVVDVLVEKSRQAARRLGYAALCVGGGVAANARLRERLEEMVAKQGLDLFVSSREYCTDNAAMAAVGWELLAAGRIAPLDLDVTPGLIRIS